VSISARAKRLHCVTAERKTRVSLHQGRFFQGHARCVWITRSAKKPGVLLRERPMSCLRNIRRTSLPRSESKHTANGGAHTMIGKVVFPYKSSIAEAILNKDGFWECEAIPCLERPLNVLHGPAFYGTSFDLTRCHECLASAARWLHGEVHTARIVNQGMTGDSNVRGHLRLFAPSAIE
jgi:hypothetical protein